MSTQRFDRPGKAEVRAWMTQRRLAAAPPPGVDEIRRALGWTLAPQAAPAAAGQALLRARRSKIEQRQDRLIRLGTARLSDLPSSPLVE